MPSTKNTEEKNGPQRLCRSENNKIIAGVAGGLGEYFSIDPVIFRILFILLTVFSGGGVLIYLVLWLVIPSKANVKTIGEKIVKENANEIKEKTKNLVRSFSVEKDNSRFFGGILILALGVIFLLNNFGFFYIFNLDRLWPLILVIIGLIIILKNEK